MKLSIKFYGFVLLFIVANAFTQSDSGKSIPNKNATVDSVKIYRNGTRLNQLFAMARIRIWDRRMRNADSLRLHKPDTLK